jgi:predicted nucleic acid-binding protein
VILNCANAKMRVDGTYTIDSGGEDVHVPRDSNDDAILATLVASQADWLITSNAALLALAERYPIIAPAAFAARHL